MGIFPLCERDELGRFKKGYKQTKEHIEKLRKSLKGINKGEKNSMWKGDEVGYNALHGWVRRHKPKPELCEKCKEKKPYDLANISGEYKRDINDFEWLCRKCHMKSDDRLQNLIKFSKAKRISDEEKKKRKKIYYQKNKERILKNHKKWCEKNPDYVKKYNKEYCKKNKERIKEKRRDYRKKHPEKIKEYQRKYRLKKKGELK